jgi:hypothetical protein
MRVSSLSDERVIALVSKHFIPAWISRDRYQMDKISREEQLLLGRIDLTRRQKKFEGGSVCVYIAKPDGDVQATMIVHKAWKPDLLIPFLKKMIDDHNPKPRKDEDIKPAALAEEPKPKGKDGRLFFVRSRFDGKENRGTSRDIVELTKTEWSAFVAAKGAKVGDSWKIPKAVAEKLLTHAYPPVAHWNAKWSKIDSCSLTATVKSVKDGVVKVRLEGKLELIYPYKGEKDDARMSAKLVGHVTCDEDGGLKAVALTSDGATYVSYWQSRSQTRSMSVAIESASAE